MERDLSSMLTLIVVVVVVVVVVTVVVVVVIAVVVNAAAAAVFVWRRLAQNDFCELFLTVLINRYLQNAFNLNQVSKFGQKMGQARLVYPYDS